MLDELDRREPDSAAFIRPQQALAEIVVSFAPDVMGRAGAVIDRDVHELPADPAGAGSAVAVDAVAFAADPAELLDVDARSSSSRPPASHDGATRERRDAGHVLAF